MRLLFDLVPLALQTDSTRLIVLPQTECPKRENGISYWAA
jgi:hypothetical protein